MSASQGGANNISNRVLACAKCNEKEKLDEDWKLFLEKKVSDKGKREDRIQRIQHWVDLQKLEYAATSEKLLQVADDLSEISVKVFDDRINKIRSSR